LHVSPRSELSLKLPTMSFRFGDQGHQLSSKQPSPVTFTTTAAPRPLSKITGAHGAPTRSTTCKYRGSQGCSQCSGTWVTCIRSTTTCSSRIFMAFSALPARRDAASERLRSLRSIVQFLSSPRRILYREFNSPALPIS
jgi:hypothetical protein